MSKMNFDFDEDDYKQEKASYESKKKRFADKMKLDEQTNKVLILGKKSKKESFYHEKVYHEIRNGKSLEMMVGCPTVDGEECKICAKNWELYEKYKEKMETEKAKNGGQAGKTSKALQVFRKREEFVVNAINLKDAEYKPMMLNLPQSASKLLFQELEEASAKSIFDLDEGRPMILTTNGKSGLLKRYETVSFSKKTANLVSSGKVEAEEILENLPSLASEKVPYTEAKLDEFLRKALAKFKAQIGDASDDEDEDEDEDEAPRKKKKPAMDDDDLDEDEDEAPKKKAPAKKKPVDDDDDLDDEDDEPVTKKAPAKKKPVEDDDDLDEDEDEAPKKKAPAKKKPIDEDDDLDDEDEPAPKKKPASKKPVDDDDDLDDEDDKPVVKKKATAKKPVTDDDFDDEDDEPAPKKKQVKRSVVDDDDLDDE